MKQKKVYIMSGVPCSGKSTWVNKHFGVNDKLISRDAIRFALLGEHDDYFSKEDEVKCIFNQQIKTAILDPEVENVFIDATHLTAKGRKAIIHLLPKVDYQLIAAITSVALDICLERNRQRSGRALVPDEVIRNMYKQRTFPTRKEGFDNIYYIFQDGSTYEWFEEGKYFCPRFI